MDLFLNYRDSFLLVKERFLELKEKNLEWDQNQKSALEKIADNSSGKWSEEYQSQARENLDEFELLCERVEKMCTILEEEAEPRICHMLNRCKVFSLNLDGMGNNGVSFNSDHSDGKDLMYNSAHHDLIVSNCDTVDTTSDSETKKMGEMKTTAGGLKKYVEPSFLDTEFSALEKGIKKQKNINYFEESFEAYVTEVADFNTTVSSQFADVVGEYSDFPVFYRTTDYTSYVEENYPRVNYAAEDEETAVFDDENKGKYGGDQGHPLWGRFFDKEFIDWVQTQPGFEDKNYFQILAYLNNMNEKGCGYVGGVTSIFAAYAGREDEFEKKYGIPYYDEKTGEINYDKLFLIYYAETNGQTYVNETDARSSYTHSIMHNYEDDPDAFKEKYGCDLFDITYDENGKEIKTLSDAAQKAIEAEYDRISPGKDKIDTGYNSNTDATANNRFAGFCSEHGDTVKEEYVPSLTQQDLDERTANGEVLQVSANEFNLYDMDGNPYSGNPVGGHRMTVTGVLPDGRLVVSSWGDQYILDPEGAEFVNIYSYKVEPGTDD